MRTTTGGVHGVDLTIERGEIFGFLGYNGVGETTAINILTTLIAPGAGSVQKDAGGVESSDESPQGRGLPAG